MPRWKKTDDYLKQLEHKGYSQYDKLRSLYDRWRRELTIKALSDF
ncbi:hypothetical protein ES707_02939 [subsurface metagenome]|jgi:hypothetical protein